MYFMVSSLQYPYVFILDKGGSYAVHVVLLVV